MNNINNGRLVYSTNPTINHEIQKNNPHNLIRVINELREELDNITPCRYESHSLGNGEWSLEAYGPHNEFIKEFVGNNGVKCCWNPDGIEDDLWEEANQWNQKMEPRRNSLERRISGLEARLSRCR